MQTRVTVAELFRIQKPTTVGQKQSISNMFFTDHSIYMIDSSQPNKLQRISFKNFSPIEFIQLPAFISERIITSLVDINNFVVFSLQKCADLLYFNPKRQIMKLSSHFKAVNQVICYKEDIATCSDDFTLRIWNIQGQKIVHNKLKHAYSGHSGKVSCLQTYQDILVSGSSDQNVIFWQNNEIYCQFKANSPIKNLLKCSESNQFIVFTQNGQIFVLNLTKIVKNRKPEVNRVIKYSQQNIMFPKNSFTNPFEIDDSFIVFRNGNSVVFVEINLGQTIISKQLCEQNHEEVLSLKLIGRMLVYGKKSQGLALLRF